MTPEQEIEHLNDANEKLADRLRDRDNELWRLKRLLEQHGIEYGEEDV